MTDEAIALSLLANQGGSPVTTKGIVFGGWDEDGYPTTATIVGFQSVPQYYYSRTKYSVYENFTSKVSTLYIQEGTTELGSQSLVYLANNVTEVILPNTLTAIQYQAFGQSAITTITFPSSLVIFGNTAFKDSTALATVYFNGQSPNISSGCFSGCTGVTLYDFSHCTSIPTLASVASLGHADDCVIKVPTALLTDWQDATNWLDLENVTWQGV